MGNGPSPSGAQPCAQKGTTTLGPIDGHIALSLLRTSADRATTYRMVGPLKASTRFAGEVALLRHGAQMPWWPSVTLASRI